MHIYTTVTVETVQVPLAFCIFKKDDQFKGSNVLAQMEMFLYAYKSSGADDIVLFE